jgi:hypothetical protein
MQAAQPIGKLLDNAEGSFQHLLTRAKTLQQLTIEVRQRLPKILAPHCLVANIRNDHLILHTDTAARANLLRYYGPSIIKHLQQHQKLSNLHRTTIRVRIILPLLPTPSQKQRPFLSQANAALLRNMASGVKDAHLKSAFLRLARRADP